MKKIAIVVLVALLSGTGFIAAAQTKATDWQRFTALAKTWVGKNDLITNKTLKALGVKQMYPGAAGYVVNFKGDEPKIKQGFAEFCRQKGINYAAIKSRLSWDIYCPS